MTQRERIEALLADGEWHSGVELNRIAFRYGARLHEMKQDGIEWEKRAARRGGGNMPCDYRLVPEGDGDADD